MSDFTIVNLADVENVAPKFQMPEGLDVRFPKRQLDTRNLGLSVQRIPSDLRMPMGHSHEQQEEIYVVIAGSGRIKLDDEVRELREWDMVRIGRGVMRNLESGPDGMTVVALGAPLFEESDAEMTPGWWTD